MKNLLILLGILTITTVGTADSDPMSAEGKLEVTARIVQPLDFLVEPVRFGDVIIGERNAIPVRDGVITIIGEPNSNVKVEMKYKNTNIDITSNGEEIEILNERNAEAPALTYKPEFVYQDTREPITSNIISLPSGTVSINASGNLIAPVDAEIGDYSSEIDIKIYYD